MLTLSFDAGGNAYCLISTGRRRHSATHKEFRVKVALLGIGHISGGVTLDAALLRAEQWLLAAAASASVLEGARE